MVDILFSYKTLKKLNRWLRSLYGASANLKMSTLQLSAIDVGLNLLNNKVLSADLCLITVQQQPVFTS